MVFAEIAQGFGNILGTTSEVGGYVAGFILLLILFLVFLVATSGIDGGFQISMVVAAITTGFNVLVGWFPVWIPILMFFVLAILLIAPFAKGSE